MFLSINSQPHSPPEAPPTHAVTVTYKEETTFQWKFPVSLWGDTRAVVRRKHLGRLGKLSNIL